MKPIQAAREAGEAADVALAAAAIARKAAAEAQATVPVPDPRDAPHFGLFRRAEGWAAARINPRRSRWPELQQMDERVVEIDQAQTRALAELGEVQQMRASAEPEHQARLADWLAGGQQGPRPVSEAGDLDTRIAELAAEVAALDIARERIFGERVAYVQKHRKRLLREAEAERKRRHRRCLTLVDELEREREELIACRQTELWAALFPHDALASEAPFTNCIAGARLKVQERHLPGVKVQLPAHSVFGLLRDDASHCATVVTTAQAAALSGSTEKELTDREATWQDRKFEHAQQRREHQEAIDAYIREWGIPPSEWA